MVLGIRTEDERRRALVAQRNALVRQVDPEAELTPFRSGFSRFGAALQNIPSTILGTPRAETEFTPFSPSAEQQDEFESLRPLEQAVLSAQSTEDFAAIAQRPDLFPDPAAPQAPVVTKPGETGFDPVTGRRIFGTPPVLGFEEGQGGPSEKFRTGITQDPGTQQLQPGPSGTFEDARVFAGPERLTTVDPGAELAATGTAPGSPTDIVARGREVPVKPSAAAEFGAALGKELRPQTQAKIEATLQGNAARRERLQGILRAVTDNPDRLRIPARVEDMFRRGLDSLVNPTPEEQQSIKAMGRIRRRVNEELVLLVKEISGAQVSDKEREFIKSITTSLPSGPTALIGVLEDVIMFNDFSTARLTMWDEAGKQGRPWLIQNDQVQTRLEEEILRTGSVMVQRGVDAATAADLATTFVEQKFGISPGGFDSMSAEFDRGAPNFGQ